MRFEIHPLSDEWIWDTKTDITYSSINAKELITLLNALIDESESSDIILNLKDENNKLQNECNYQRKRISNLISDKQALEDENKRFYSIIDNRIQSFEDNINRLNKVDGADETLVETLSICLNTIKALKNELKE